MSEITKHSLENSLLQLKCHFTWNLYDEESSLDDLENRVRDQVQFLNKEFKAIMYNLFAYVKHLRGQNKAALEYLQQAEEFILHTQARQGKIRSLVTWGNYAWVYYHMGSLPEAQAYIDKVGHLCKKFASSYRIECPEIDCEKGWALLKWGEKYYEQAKVCFEKALQKKPTNPEFSLGLAITLYRLGDKAPTENTVRLLRQAIQLNPDNQYVHVLLALTLQKTQKQAEGDKLVEEALKKRPCPTDVLCSAAKYYRNKGTLDTAIELLKKALESVPNNVFQHLQIGCCYRAKIRQIQRSRGYTTKEKEAELWETTRHALDHFKRVVELNANLPRACSDLACLYAITGQYDKAEYYFQKEFSKDLPPAERQVLHLRYGNFQQYQRLQDDTAIHHYLQGLNINGTVTEKEKLIVNLRKIAHKRLSKNASDAIGWQLSRFIRELNRKGHQWDSVPAETSGVVPPALRAEKGSEEKTVEVGGTHHPEKQKALERACNQSRGLHIEKSKREV
ncbi:interferon-induced protein with tetratricopeptide repeats 2-like [Neovison vison]|uniref:interferon-induced protein with tetratricopeptide repeats 2-like n=1 Tax=Neovison vison TaxID=452646 RepID=UPI001CF0C225|nr:interferon-induced protein with tetratricopeptide repeats 2-like [Neogale vison]